MKKHLVLVILVACMYPWSAQSQEGDSTPPAPLAAEEEVVELTGDVLTLRSGQVLSGVQIVSESARAYMVQVVEGVDPLVIPRKQVLSVVSDDIEPWSKIYKAAVEANKEVFITGQLVPPELVRALQAPLSEEAKAFKEMDFILVLKALAAQVRLPLKFDQPVKDLLLAKRSWSVTVEPGMNFLTLSTNLLEDFPILNVAPVDKHIMVSIKPVAAKPGVAKPARPPQRRNPTARNRRPVR